MSGSGASGGGGRGPLVGGQSRLPRSSFVWLDRIVRWFMATTPDANTAVINNISHRYDLSNDLVVTVSGNRDTQAIYITAAVDATPADPTASVYDATIAAGNGTVTIPGVPAGLDSYVSIKAVGANLAGALGDVLLVEGVAGAYLSDGVITASKLTKNAQSFNTNIQFYASDRDTVQWTFGTLTLADGTTYSIAAGNIGNIGFAVWIYFDPDVSTTLLQTTTVAGDAVTENGIILCYADDAPTGQKAFFLPAFGFYGINQLNLSPDTVGTTQVQDDAITTPKLIANAVTAAKITAGAVTAGKIDALAVGTNELQANSVTAAKISVATLSAISADVGELTAGQLHNVADTYGLLLSGTVPAGWTRYLNLIDASKPFLKHEKLELTWAGGADFSGDVSAASFTATTATFDGSLKVEDNQGWTAFQVNSLFAEVLNASGGVRMRMYAGGVATGGTLETPVSDMYLLSAGDIQLHPGSGKVVHFVETVVTSTKTAQNQWIPVKVGSFASTITRYLRLHN